MVEDYRRYCWTHKIPLSPEFSHIRIVGLGLSIILSDIFVELGNKLFVFDAVRKNEWSLVIEVE